MVKCVDGAVTNDVFGALGVLSDLADGQPRRVGRDDALRLAHLLVSRVSLRV